jgi:hypothetical protein
MKVNNYKIDELMISKENVVVILNSTWVSKIWMTGHTVIYSRIPQELMASRQVRNNLAEGQPCVTAHSIPFVSEKVLNAAD